jgi:2-desacetyl-2-hydroxyethyl bacteriochlorophyllide A dehydrogenase
MDAHRRATVGPVRTGAVTPTMRAVVLRGPERLEIRDVERPRPAPHEVLVRVQAVGLCGTDMHIYAGHANYNADRSGRPIPLTVEPQILGHEIAGVVAEVGSEVRDLDPGHRVVLDQGRTCVGEGRAPLCEYCATGDSHQCELYREHGITGLQGGLAEYISVPGVNAVRIRSALDPATAVITEPLGCVLHATDMLTRAVARYSLAPESAGQRIRSILLLGAGPSGLLFVQVLRRVLGFDGLLLVSEPDPTRRALAEGFGADVLDPSSMDLSDGVAERTGGRRVELLIEASGAGEPMALIPELLRKQGTLLLYGHGHAGVDLSVLNSIQFLEPTWLAPAGASGGFEPDGRPSVYVRALELIESGVIDAASLITHRYPSLDAVPGAFARDPEVPGYIKGVVSLVDGG